MSPFQFSYCCSKNISPTLIFSAKDVQNSIVAEPNGRIWFSTRTPLPSDEVHETPITRMSKIGPLHNTSYVLKKLPVREIFSRRSKFCPFPFLCIAALQETNVCCFCRSDCSFHYFRANHHNPQELCWKSTKGHGCIVSKPRCILLPPT